MTTHRRGFTLVELVAAVAIVFVLMLGVNYVFKATTDTIGTGVAVSNAVRAIRATEGTLRSDFALAMPMTADGDARMPALVINSQQNDLITGAGVFASKVDADAFNDGRFRTDTLSYFQAGAKFNRRTADNGYLTSDGTADAAWVWLGHLDVANGVGTFAGPGAGTFATNRDNYYANDWTLGRVVMLLRPAASMAAAGDVQRVQQSAGVALAPLGYNSAASTGENVRNARYDQAEWDRAAFMTSVGTAGGTWWTHLANRSPAGGTYRFRYDGFPQRPLTSAGAASTVPAFVPNCRAFIVEFAGDFTDPSGAPTPDGIIDNYTPLTGALAGVPQIRWYGFPRDVDGNNIIRWDSGDVVPVVTVTNGAAQPFEMTGPTGTIDRSRNYGAGSGGTPTTTADRYVVAWHANMPDAVRRPKLIRVILELADPNGRLAEPQTVEMVFNVP